MRRQVFSHRFRQHLIWLLIMLFLTAPLIWILSSVTLIQGSWAVPLTLFFTGTGVVLILLRWHVHTQTADLPAEALLSKEVTVVHVSRTWHEITLPPEATFILVRQDETEENMERSSTDQRSATTFLTTLSVARPSRSTRTLIPGPQKTPRLLLVSVTDVEVRAVLTIVPSAVKTVIQKRTYYDLGMLGETRTYLVQATGMGPTGVRPCLEDGIRALAPQAIILVGIAFGLQPHRQQIGDVLLSRQIQDYDPQRWGIGPDQQVVLQGRGNRMTATEWLLDRFVAGKQDWPGSAMIQTGLILSGSLLIDHQEVRDRLLQLAPEAVGGEMEGATLCDVALRHHVDWIVVKAISDWADGKKRQNEQSHQQLAAKNATRFVLHVIRQPGFLPKE